LHDIDTILNKDYIQSTVIDNQNALNVHIKELLLNDCNKLDLAVKHDSKIGTYKLKNLSLSMLTKAIRFLNDDNFIELVSKVSKTTMYKMIGCKLSDAQYHMTPTMRAFLSHKFNQVYTTEQVHLLITTIHNFTKLFKFSQHERQQLDQNLIDV
jgi:ribosomal protein S25